MNNAIRGEFLTLSCKDWLLGVSEKRSGMVRQGGVDFVFRSIVNSGFGVFRAGKGRGAPAWSPFPPHLAEGGASGLSNQ
ncbi:hypothetical protein SAMN04489718_1025 [Actinopolyspora saharensis]|uniref:Uncharacterized protein n=1 Tax=Actinopolyspora saharensis TaxID=995062 RepID=A0A1H0ZH11_9ACTN|nr:hypothetical protein SAMN04489718_1025 [Actinopolyspora saharensis]